MELQVHRYADAGAFLNAAGTWLASTEVENNVMLTIASSIADGTRTLKESPYFAAAVDGNEIDCCASRTPPHNMLITSGTPHGLAALAADAFGAFGRLPGVNGPRQAAAGFVEAWLAVAGGRADISMRQRLHKLDRLNPDLPVVKGTLRVVDPSERDLAVEWVLAFAREALPDAPTGDIAEGVDRHLSRRTLYFWDDGAPVTMCADAGSSGSIARINSVYTPPERRRRGYATAAVAALTRLLLDGGRRYCCLYTDLANSTSNSVYRRIGYQPVCDIDQYTFSEL